jgi:hypothetical protein
VKSRVIGALILATTTIGPAAFAQEPQPVDSQEMGQPPAPMPEPPPPPEAAYASPAGYAPAPVAVAAPAPAGQWVYTQQYGWVWMPYGANYTYVTATDAAYTFAYYPRFGWRWLAAPWVLSVGPTPRWGHLGPVHFAWYGRPRFHGYVAHSTWYGRPEYRAPIVHATWGRPAVRGNVVWHNEGGHGEGHGWGRGGHHR